MIRITIQPEKGRTVVTIDGHLIASDVEEVSHARQSITGDVVLDLGGVGSCVNAGAKALRDWLDDGAQFMNAAPYLRMLLEGAGSPPRRKGR